jgi:hypothetical protein
MSSPSADQTANAQVLDFNRDFSVRNLQQYTLLNNAWEVYVGRFMNPNQDGLFLYDRSAGQARVVSFDPKLQVSHFQDMQNLSGNWEVFSGDFNGSGRAQVLFYDPSSGDAQFLIFSPNLSVADQKDYSGWGTNLALYVGHFGMPTLSVMLYDPQAGESTFVAFDKSLEVTHQYQVASWDQRWQVLIGAFVDRSRCLASGNCTTGDDILVLNRQTGQMQQYVFSFGRQYQVFDNRSQAFLREGVAAGANLGPVDTTSFSLLGTLDTSIRGEELY